MGLDSVNFYNFGRYLMADFMEILDPFLLYYRKCRIIGYQVSHESFRAVESFDYFEAYSKDDEHVLAIFTI